MGGWWVVDTWWVTARAPPRKVENRKKVQINPTQLLAHHRCTAVVRTAELLCCRCGLVGAYCSTAVVLLWWWVCRWVGGGWWVLGRWRLALSPGRWRIVRTCKCHTAPGVPQVYRCRAYCRTAVLPLWIGWYVLLHCCCTAVVVAWSVGGGWMVGVHVGG